ncbi:hypothetical protein [Demequina sp.]|uniref:hypothetical protein n=1 Tax=Demequina sp. TaxID=2050685 RepID=UPI0025BE24F1|nr:hypothetical protein [Demequina sp.]
MDVYRARGSLVWGWLCVGLGGIFAVSDIVASGLSGARVGVGLGVCVALVGLAVYLRPAVIVTQEGVVFRNILHTASAPFARIREVSMRWSLEILGDDGKKAGAFAAPASRGARTGVFGNDAAERARLDERERLPDSTGSRLYEAWMAWTDAHDAEPDPAGPSINRRPDPGGLALVLGAVAALVFALVG